MTNEYLFSEEESEYWRRRVINSKVITSKTNPEDMGFVVDRAEFESRISARSPIREAAEKLTERSARNANNDTASNNQNT